MYETQHQSCLRVAALEGACFVVVLCGAVKRCAVCGACFVVVLCGAVKRCAVCGDVLFGACAVHPVLYGVVWCCVVCIVLFMCPRVFV